MITLTQGYEALVDDEDYTMLMQHTWHVIHSGNTHYAVSHPKWRQHIRMHRLVLRLPRASKDCTELVDHRDQNGLNNQKDNLRITTRSINMFNSKTPLHNTSGRKGVTRASHRDRWVAQGMLHGVKISLYYGPSFDDACRAREKWENSL